MYLPNPKIVMSSSSEIVQNLASSLNVNVPRVTELVDKFGLYGAARILGYDVSHYDNLLLAGRLAIADLRQKAPKTFKEYAEIMKERFKPSIYDFIMQHHEELQKAIDEMSDLDYDHDWFSANTMITTYSAKRKYHEEGIETPQYTWMRLAVQFYHDVSLKDVIKSYKDMAEGWYTPASPTIFNAGMKNGNLSSCFLLQVGDSLDSILETLYRGGMISKGSGGLGFDVSTVRHSEIGDVGWSKGIIPMLRLYNDLVRYVDQTGRRKGAATVFLRPHHLDVEAFIEMVRKIGDSNERAHDLNICLWTSWIFWERVKEDGDWTLFCPARAPQLNNLYGTEFTKAYLAAEQDTTIKPHHKKVIKARALYDKIRTVQKETGMPYLMNGDAANLKSNQRNLGYIKSSNLCLEIVEYTDPQTIASCNLSSISLRMFAKQAFNGSYTESFDFHKLASITRCVVDNLNAVIDHNAYPLDEQKNGKVQPGIINTTNKKHRPLGIGASGFAEALHALDLPFEAQETSKLNKLIFACMYFNALARSVQLAIKHGAYDSFAGSPASEGKLQFDLWKEEFDILGPNAARKAEDDEPVNPSEWGQRQIFLEKDGALHNIIEPTWEDLKSKIIKYGLRNSLLIALMPTASTAQIRRNCESVEAHQNNMYSRKVLTCSYPVLNRYLVEDLEKLNLWNNNMVEFIKVKNGSIAGITSYVKNNITLFPMFNGDEARLTFLEKKYKTMWEIPQKTFMKLAAERARYIDQSASTNIYIRDCDDDKLKACQMYANMLGLKTIMYYLRQTGGETIKFTADPDMLQYIENSTVDNTKEETKEVTTSSGSKKKVICTDEVCISCQ